MHLQLFTSSYVHIQSTPVVGRSCQLIIDLFCTIDPVRCHGNRRLFDDSSTSQQCDLMVMHSIPNPWFIVTCSIPACQHIYTTCSYGAGVQRFWLLQRFWFL